MMSDWRGELSVIVCALNSHPRPCQSTMTEETTVGCLCKVHLTRVPQNLDEVIERLTIFPLRTSIIFFPTCLSSSGSLGIWSSLDWSTVARRNEGCAWESVNLFFERQLRRLQVLHQFRPNAKCTRAINHCTISAHYHFGKPPFCHLNSSALWLPL